MIGDSRPGAKGSGGGSGVARGVSRLASADNLGNIAAVSRRQQRANLTAFLIGVVATAVVISGYAFGWLDWIELKTLDLRFRYANSITEDPRIACVDIDDGAIELVGRWPWPRDVQAALLSILAEAGAKTVLYDVTLYDAETTRSLPPRDIDVAADLFSFDTSSVPVAYPDAELRTVIAAMGSAYLAFDYGSGDPLHSAAFRSLLEAVRANDAKEVERLVRQHWPEAFRIQGTAAPVGWAQLVWKLEPSPAQPTGTLDVPEQVRAHDVERCRELAFEHAARRWLNEDPQRRNERAGRLLPLFYRDVDLTSFPRGSGPYEELALSALTRVLSVDWTVGEGIVPLARVAAAAPEVDDVTPVNYLHARAARRCGFVAFDPDSDGVMRHTRLLVNYNGRVLPQLAFAVAFDELGLSADDLRAEPGLLHVGRGADQTPLPIQLDDNGYVLVPWLPVRDWTGQFGEHVPIGVAWEVFDRRLSISHNRQYALSLLAAAVSEGAFEEHRQYYEDMKRRLELDSELLLARYHDDAESVADIQHWIEEYDKVLPAGEQALREAVAGEIERGDEASVPPALLRGLQRAFAANDAYEREIGDSLRWLRGHVDGMICLVGYTATALPDMVPIPTHPRAPGVIAHANLLNGLLTGQMVRWASVEMNALLAAVCGVVVSIVSVRRRPREAAIVVAGLVLGLVGIVGYWVFYAQTYWVAVTPAAGAMLAAYFAIATYRYIFLDREQRQLTTTLSQYTSATLARKMAEDAELCRRAEMREVSAMFTDLRGFTPISERIGAERTQRVLNVCLGRCSEVMLRYEGMINKFIGDGIFAFWNPVIYPQADHALRACETAVDLQTAMRELAEEQRKAGGDEVFGELVLRVGVATGQAVVGPCGSEQKYDYTCIGDTVNLASRLESANKFYGTLILIGGETRDAVGERFAVRPLGGVQVKGKREPVPIYELLGRAGEVPEEERAYADLFGEAVTQFQQRHWSEALKVLADCRKQRPHDLAAQRYAEATAQLHTDPPGDDWTGAIELTEK